MKKTFRAAAVTLFLAALLFAACGPLCKIAPSLCSTGRLDVAVVQGEG